MLSENRILLNHIAHRDELLSRLSEDSHCLLNWFVRLGPIDYLAEPPFYSLIMKSEIVNVVATASLNQKLNLDLLGLLANVFHDEAVYQGSVAYFRSPNIRGTVSLFSSGKMISLGANSEEDALCELETAKDYLVDCGAISGVALHPKVQNLVAMIDLEEEIDLESMAMNAQKTFSYDPERFPGGFMKLRRPCKATILCFASGKIIITGLKKTNEIELVIPELLKIIEKVAK